MSDCDQCVPCPEVGAPIESAPRVCSGRCARWDESHFIVSERLGELVPRPSVDPLVELQDAMHAINDARRVIICSTADLDKIEGAVRERNLDGMVTVRPSEFVEAGAVLIAREWADPILLGNARPS